MSVSIYQEMNLTPEQVELIKSQICKGASDDELKLFLYTAKKAGVDPLLKQIYSVRRGGQMVIQMGIDGFRAVAARQNDYAPGDESFEYDKDGNLISATVSIYKLLPNGQLHKFSKTAYWTEYAQWQKDKYSGKQTLSQFWKQYPRVMLAKCAEAAALRKGWPQVFSKIYAPEELQQVEKEAYIEKQCVDEASKEEETIDIKVPEGIESIVEEASKKEETIDIKVPEGIEKQCVDEYFEMLADELGKPIPLLKKRAQENPDKFWKKFEEWIHKEAV